MIRLTFIAILSAAFLFTPNTTSSQSRKEVVAKMISDTETKKVDDYVNTISLAYPEHVSLTEPYVLRNTAVVFEDNNPCWCTFVVEELLDGKEVDKRTITYDLHLSQISEQSEWSKKGEIFSITTEHELPANVLVYKDGEIVNEVETNQIEIATPIDFEEEFIAALLNMKSKCGKQDVFKPKLKGKKLLLNESGQSIGIDSSDQNVITLTSPYTENNNEITIDLPYTDLTADIITSTELTQSDISISINGKEISKKSSKKSLTQTDKGYSYSNFIELEYGENKITLSCPMNNHIKPLDVTITYDPVLPNLFIYSFGIPSQDLDYTTQDSKDFVEAFENMPSAKNLYNRIHIQTMTTYDETSKLSLAKKLESISNLQTLDNKLTEKDLLIIHISSHGFYDKTNQKYKIATSEYDPLYSKATSIDFQDDIINALADVSCKKLFFIDACYSGSINFLADAGSKDGGISELDLAKSVSRLLSS